MKMAGMNGTINRYRVMALIAGVMSLLLWFVYMPLEGFKSNSDEGNSLLWIAIAHGYIYMIYVLTAVQLSVKAKWSLTRMLKYILAGTLPIASFIAERRVVAAFLSTNENKDKGR